MILAGMGASRIKLFGPMKRATSGDCKRSKRFQAKWTGSAYENASKKAYRLCIGLTAGIRCRHARPALVVVLNFMNYEP
jgi:hypothetical protein